MHMLESPSQPVGVSSGSPVRPCGPTNPFDEFPRLGIEQSIHARFEQQVRLHPDRVAVKGPDGTLTYATLNRAANAVAHELIEMVGEGARPVGLLVEHSVLLAVALIGALKAGKIGVPLDPAHPIDRLIRILADADPAALLTTAASAELASRIGVSGRPAIDTSFIAARLERATNPDVAVDPSDAAMILYTSGSTGLPKGVVLSHRKLLHRTMLLTNSAHVTPDDRLSLLGSPGASAPLNDVLTALLNGAGLYPVDPMKLGIGGLARWLVDEQITIYHSTPSLYRALVAAIRTPGAFPHLRLVDVAGEGVSRGDLESFKRVFSDDCLFHNRYACTEVSQISECFADKSTTIDGERMPIGWPVDDMALELWDERGQPVPRGEIGEIVAKTRFTASRYWRRLNHTADTFLTDPADTERRIYRTGDLGRQLPDGSFEHLGRNDGQVKIRGNRVEVAEVEAALTSLESVAHAAVTTEGSDLEGFRLVAYVVPSGAVLPTTAALRAELSVILPEPMLPSSVVILDELPLTPNGKLDRAGLSVVGDRPSRERATPLPRTEMEQRIATLWQHVLEHQSFGIDDDFFDLGGDSLRAARLFAEIEQQFQIFLPPSAIVDAPTVRRLSAIVALDSAGLTRSEVVAVQSGGSRRPLFCVHPSAHSVAASVALGRHLGPDQPLYALQPWGENGPVPSETSVEDLAKRYVAAVRRVQANGPYLLSGRCFGGIVALEMAHQLRAQGEQIGLVAIFDATPPRPFDPTRKVTAAERAASRLGPGPTPQAVELFAKRQYRARPYSEPLVLIWSSEFSDDETRRGHLNRWGKIASGGLIHHVVQTDHAGMFREPGVRHLADVLGNLLGSATVRG